MGVHGGSRDRTRRTPFRARWHRTVVRYGWRAYAVPVLAVITVLALVGPLRPTPAPHRQHVTVEGLSKATSGFEAGQNTPGVALAAAPVNVNLGGDGSMCAGNTAHRLVLVDISAQHMWACNDQREIRTSAVTTGRGHGDRTPVGSWTVQGKQRDRYLVGPGYKDYVHYWVPFNGDFGLHDAPWQKMPFGSPDYSSQGSHGCVHFPTPMMAWIYHWAVVGRTVVTVVA